MNHPTLSTLQYFLPYQKEWIQSCAPLKLMQKSRQIGISYADAYHSVRLASQADNRLDVYISSRDRFQAKLYIEDCKHWAEVLHLLIQDHGEIMLDPDYNASAFVIQFANGGAMQNILPPWGQSFTPSLPSIHQSAIPPPLASPSAFISVP